MPVERKEVGDRGLVEFAEIVDSYGHRVRVQSSSAIPCTQDDDDGRPCVWIFAEDQEGNSATHHALHGWSGVSPHLTVSQARDVRDALSDFLAWAGVE